MRHLTCLSACVALSLLAASTPSAQSKTQRVYLKVLNDAGTPVSDLGITEVTIKEGGTPQSVTKVGLSNHPLRIALLVDTSSGSRYELPDLRAGLNAFVDAVPAPHELLFVTTGTQVRVRVQPTADRKKAKDAAQSLFAETGGGSGTLLYDALTEVDDRFMKKAVDRTPIFVIVTGDGNETSQRYDERGFSQFSQLIALRDVPVHAIVFSKGTSQAPLAMSLHLTQATRGHSDVIAVSNALPDKLKALATSIVESEGQMATWYQVDYVSSSKEARPAIEAAITRAGVRAQLATTRRLP